jgi:hydroxymethylbilane synthase
MQKLIKIGTRASLLAMTQSTNIKNLIEARYPGTTVELVKIITKGDKIVDVPLAKVGGKGLFVKELEEAMLSREVDMAVHSMKDVPSELPDELHIGVVTKREDPRDAFLSVKYKTFADLPKGAKIGTSSLRRKSQLAALRPDLVIEDLRGNLDTRIRKLDEGIYDAIILATAGLNRMQWSERITARFSPEEMLPAVAQGAVGIELRKDNEELLAGLAFLRDEETTIAVDGERAFLHRLEGGCQVPIGAFGTVDGSKLTLTGLVASVDGKEVLKKEVTGEVADAKTMGVKLAEELLDMGGRRILEEVYGANLA